MTLRGAGEAYDRKMKLQLAGIDLAAVIGAVCRNAGVEEKQLANPSKRPQIARAELLGGEPAGEPVKLIFDS